MFVWDGGCLDGLGLCFDLGYDGVLCLGGLLFSCFFWVWVGWCFVVCCGLGLRFGDLDLRVFVLYVLFWVNGSLGWVD